MLIELSIVGVIILTYLAYVLRRLIGGRERALLHDINRRYQRLKKLTRRLSVRAAAGVPLHPAAEWLLDNFYAVEQRVRTFNLSVSHELYRRLSKQEGRPAVLHCARAICVEGGYHVTEAAMVQGLHDAQKGRPFKSADIWALPDMLHFCLVKKMDELGQSIARWEAHTPADEEECACMAACITSLVEIGAVDYERVFSRTSRLERLLTRDPSGTYPHMDFASRDYYRHVAERLAKRLKTTEADVAQQALLLAKDPQKKNDPRQRHVGYYLIESGVQRLYEAFGRGGPGIRIGRFLNKYRTWLYIGALLLAIRFVSFNVAYVARVIGAAWWVAVLVGALSVIPASEIAVKLVNWTLLHFIPVKFIPKLELSGGIPAEGATFVIIPTLLTSPEMATELVRRLEVFYHANSSDNLYFALVGDFRDGPSASGEHDQAIIDAANAEVTRLNQTYGDRFFYLNRRRVYNPASGVYAGWERKRGAIVEFVRLLHGEDTTFDVISCDRTALPRTPYILTLDADTSLLRGSAAKLVGAMLHPLNAPVLNRDKTRVQKGYGLLQPRVCVDADSSHKSWFAKIFAGQGGLDPYSYAVSDIYQDLFGEGIFTGKGIFSAEAYYKLLDHVLPDNRVLSHDLLEGCFLRAGLVSDVTLLDGFPYKFQSYMARYHRWVRGDWQLVPYLLRKIKNDRGEKRRNPLSGISRWKLIDNLRRSLVAPALLVFVLLAAAWPVHGWVWGVFAALTLLVSLLTLAADSLLGVRPMGRVVKVHSSVWTHVARVVAEAGLLLAFLPYQAYVVLDAVIRTLYRLWVSKRNLLEWVTAAEADKRMANSFAASYRKMWISPVAGGVAVALCVLFAPGMWWLAAALALVWCAAPAVAYALSAQRSARLALPSGDIHYLRGLARRTWRYFEDFCGEADNWLAPDNFQEEPAGGVAHRTSPTNIGILLASVVAAYDFGYVTASDMLDRLQHTMDTLRRLPKWRGHLYNWYDTLSLQPLAPRYVSTVDNGNYVCTLITVKMALEQMVSRPVLGTQHILGLLDTARLAELDDAQTEGLERLAAGPLRLADLKCELERLLATPHQGEWGAAFDRMAGALHASLVQAGCGNPTLDDLEGGRVRTLLAQLEADIAGTHFTHLYDKERELFAIGYDVENKTLSSSHYDLLATEARQTSFLAVARGEVPPSHWSRLSRPLTKCGRRVGLVSWTGTMFEYLMPLLFLPAREGTLWAETYRMAVECQRRYGKAHGGLWGVSECAFYRFDINMNYQYKAVGVPALALRRGMEQDDIVAPYAALLALMVQPGEAVQNLRALDACGMVGRYGMYESLDRTPARLYADEQHAAVKAYMVHHQGMGFLALDNVVNNGVMQARFTSDPQVRAADGLLEETIPSRVVLSGRPHVPARRSPVQQVRLCAFRQTVCTPGAVPFCNVLSNGTYSVLVTDRGTGWSQCDGMMVTRFRADLADNRYGTLLYARCGGAWVGACGAPFAGGGAEVEFSGNEAVFTQRREDVDVRTRLFVSPDDNVELREVEVRGPAVTQLMSYCEVALSAPLSDEAHPAFSNLFVYTEWLPDCEMLVARRRPRDGVGPTHYVGHFVVGDYEHVSFESDRMRFVGRGNRLDTADALRADVLSGTVGAVLDPVLSLRVQASPGARVAFVTAFAHSKEELLRLRGRYTDPRMFPTLREGAKARSRAENKQLALTAEQEQHALRLLSALVFPHPGKRRYADVVARNQLGQRELWKYGISGDDPILLYRAGTGEDTDVLEELVKAHLYLRFKGFRCELVILYADGGYWDKAGASITDVLRRYGAEGLRDCRGGIYVLNGAGMEPEYADLLVTVARVVADADTDLDALLSTLPHVVSPMRFAPREGRYPAENVAPDGLALYNGYGGYDGDDYVMVLPAGTHTPLPWSHVVAHEGFGFIATESGGGYTWAENSRENRLTPWTNDPVSDAPGEAVCVRDDMCGRLYSPAQSPAHAEATHVVRYGFGFVQYGCADDGIVLQMTQFVPHGESAKLSLLELRNTGPETRELSVFCYVRPVLGALESMARPYLVTAEQGGMLTVRNSYNSEFLGRVMLLGCTRPPDSVTGDRSEFYPGADSVPQALRAAKLSGRTGLGYDACLAVQVRVRLAAGATERVGFVLGQGMDDADAARIADKYRDVDTYEAALREVTQQWSARLSAVRVQTPDAQLNHLANGWLPYQTLCCRLFARSAFYQSGGAYGFRDQLQDSLAALHIDASLTRRQILLHAAHQFAEGDVQHWWHQNPDASLPRQQRGPEGDKGIRTRFSDDLLWLPYVACEYVRVTGDIAVWDEQVPYIAADPLPDGVDEHYSIPLRTDVKDGLYEHCARAIDRALRFGEHGLPLMGSGDWNDGMNTVGNRGRGESVWLGWFLCDILRAFGTVATQRGDRERAQRYAAVREQLVHALDQNAWDGAWYRRAYFDDGSPLGSADNTECRIDSIAQSWALLSGAGDADKVRAALKSVDNELVNRELGIIRLLWPPFEHSEPSPGYIMSYVPGVRENGGQYAHAAVWVVQAFARSGDGDRAVELAHMLSPLAHSADKQCADVYKAEPYVMTADVYATPQHAGRGGWTWYTGAAGWYWRVLLEDILGVRREGGVLTVAPVIAAAWDGFTVRYRYGGSMYDICVHNPHHVSTGVKRLTVDGTPREDIPLKDDGKSHRVEVDMGNKPKGNAGEATP